MPETPAPARIPTRRSAGRAGGCATRAGRYPRGAPPPLLVEVRRAGIVESRHRGHVVQVGADGRIERGLGDPDLLVTLRSAVKPFGIVPFLESGAADDLGLSGAEIAMMAGSHAGEDLHVRTLQAVFRRASLSQNLLACGSVGMPLDPLTAARLARDGEDPGAIRHMCSGYHAASILLSRYAGWGLETYFLPDHPSQVAAASAVARVFGVAPSSLRAAVDACGLPTFAFPLVDVARAFALLADPLGAAPDAGRARLAPSLTRIRDAMVAHPEMVGGTRDMTDTVLMKAASGRLVAKAGAEALRGIGLLPGARGDRAPAAGVATKIEDGDGYDRATKAVAVEALAQIGVYGERDLRHLARQHRPQMLGPRGEVLGEAVPGFELAPISELL